MFIELMRSRLVSAGVGISFNIRHTHLFYDNGKVDILGGNGV